MPRSAFLLTINSNSTDEAYISPLKAAFKEWYGSLADRFDYPGGRLSDDKLDMDIECRKRVCEVGKKKHRVHLHAVVVVDHNTWVQLSANKTRAFFSEALDLPSYHLDIKWLKTDQDIERAVYYCGKDE